MKLTESPKFGCGVVISFGEDGSVFMKHGRSGTCKHCSAEAMARLINIAPRASVITALKRLSCESALPGKSSCYDYVSKRLSDLDKKEETHE